MCCPALHKLLLTTVNMQQGRTVGYLERVVMESRRFEFVFLGGADDYVPVAPIMW